MPLDVRQPALPLAHELARCPLYSIGEDLLGITNHYLLITSGNAALLVIAPHDAAIVRGPPAAGGSLQRIAKSRYWRFRSSTTVSTANLLGNREEDGHRAASADRALFHSGVFPVSYTKRGSGVV